MLFVRCVLLGVLCGAAGALTATQDAVEACRLLGREVLGDPDNNVLLEKSTELECAQACLEYRGCQAVDFVKSTTECRGLTEIRYEGSADDHNVFKYGCLARAIKSAAPKKAKETEREWCEHKGKYLERYYPGQEPFATLIEAQIKCESLFNAEEYRKEFRQGVVTLPKCGGVTKESDTKFTLRLGLVDDAGEFLKDSETETSYTYCDTFATSTEE